MSHDIGLARFAEHTSFIPLTLHANHQNPGDRSSLAFDCNSLQYFLASGDHASMCMGSRSLLVRMPRAPKGQDLMFVGAEERGLLGL